MAGLAAVDTPTLITVSRLARHIGAMRYRYGNEVQLHEVLGTVLTDAGIVFEREYRLDAHNRADFWLDGIVIEVKIAGSAGAALRQVDRYIGLPQVRGVLLAATPAWADLPLQKRPTWADKPFAIARLQRQAL